MSKWVLGLLLAGGMAAFMVGADWLFHRVLSGRTASTSVRHADVRTVSTSTRTERERDESDDDSEDATP